MSENQSIRVSAEGQAKSTYEAQSARDAQASGYGDKSYWDHLDQSAQEHCAYFIGKGDEVMARLMLTQSLGDALIANNGA